jgi:hypothetical protein
MSTNWEGTRYGINPRLSEFKPFFIGLRDYSKRTNNFHYTDEDNEDASIVETFLTFYNAGFIVATLIGASFVFDAIKGIESLVK